LEGFCPDPAFHVSSSLSIINYVEDYLFMKNFQEITGMIEEKAGAK